MPLKAVVDSLDDVKEGLKEFYTEGDDGKFRLDAEGVEDVGGLKSALGSERESRKQAERALKKLEGIDPKRFKELTDAEEKRQRNKAKDEGDWEAREAQILEKHALALKEKEGDVNAANQAVERHLIDAEATKAIVAEKGSPRLLLPEVKRHVRVIRTDGGEFVARVVDKDGNERIGTISDGKANPMTITELVGELKQDKELAGAFAGSGASGSGATETDEKPGGGSVQTIASGDNKAFLANIDTIAAGKTKVE